MLLADTRENPLSRNKLYLAFVNLGNAFFSFFGPQSLYFWLRGKVKAGEQLLYEAHSRLGWER